MTTAFQKLIKRYAKGRQICNCGNAYYKNCGHGSSFDSKLGRWIDRDDMPTCEHGCSANQISAKEYVAEEVLKEFKRLERRLKKCTE